MTGDWHQGGFAELAGDAIAALRTLAPLTAPIRTFDRHTLAYDPGADIDAIRIPSLWIYGDADTIIPVQDSIAVLRKAKSRPQPEIIVLPKAGHSFTVSETAIPRLADAYPEVAIRWLRTVSR
jgi:pimeloyl-ACP methyl ester carboxylesterase